MTELWITRELQCAQKCIQGELHEKWLVITHLKTLGAWFAASLFGSVTQSLENTLRHLRHSASLSIRETLNPLRCKASSPASLCVTPLSLPGTLCVSHPPSLRGG